MVQEGMELIRPLYYVKEADIIKWRERNDLHFIRFTEHCTMCDNGEILEILCNFMVRVHDSGKDP